MAHEQKGGNRERETAFEAKRRRPKQKKNPFMQFFQGGIEVGDRGVRIGPMPGLMPPKGFGLRVRIPF